MGLAASKLGCHARLYEIEDAGAADVLQMPEGSNAHRELHRTEIAGAEHFRQVRFPVRADAVLANHLAIG
jgi:hypothetical protein